MNRRGMIVLLALVLALVPAAAGPALADEAPAGDAPSGDAGNAAHLESIAGAFGTDAAELAAAYDEGGMGYGALFKLALYGAVKGMSLTEVLAIPADEEGEYSFGELFGGLSEDELMILAELPKNFGQLVAATHRPDHAGPMDRDEREAWKEARKAAKEEAKAARRATHGAEDGED